MAEKLSRSTKAGRNLRPLTKRTLHDEDVAKEDGQVALKVSDSEHHLIAMVNAYLANTNASALLPHYSFGSVSTGTI